MKKRKRRSKLRTGTYRARMVSAKLVSHGRGVAVKMTFKVLERLKAV